MAPIASNPAAMYDSKLLERIVAHMGDVPEAIGAQFWMISDDDFSLMWPQATSASRNYEARLRDVLPEVFRSADGHVSIYSLDCLRHREEPSCQTADQLLLSPEVYRHADP